MHLEHPKADAKLAWSKPSVVELTTRATASGSVPGVIEGLQIGPSTFCNAAS
jgi:hypothetical protein